MKKTLWIVILALICISCLISTVAFAAVSEEDLYPGTDMSYYESLPNVYSQREWTFANIGSNAKGSYSQSGDELYISPEGIPGTNGKIADEEIGMNFFYTKIDAAMENFYIKATFTITNIKTGGDNQNGFGIICTDTIGPAKDGKYINYIASCCTKMSTSYNVPGGRAMFGYMSEDGTDPTDGAENAYEGTYYKPFSLEGEAFAPAHEKGMTYTFILRKSNTGYHAMLTESSQGYCGSESTFYDPSQLLKQDGEHVYVGFFTARNVAVKVTDVFMTVVDPKTDQKKYEDPNANAAQPVKMAVLSPTSRTSDIYPFSMYTDSPGTITLQDYYKNEYLSAHVDAETIFTKEITITKNNLPLTALFTPDNPDQKQVVRTFVVKKGYLPTVDGVSYVSPTVNSGKGSGTKDDPASLYDAFAFALPGTTIILPDGTYKPNGKLTIERGVDGTADKPIVFRGETIGGVTLDFSNASTTNESFLLGGNYWHIVGINFTNSQNNSKGIRISGSNNILEQCKAYNNANSGIQISGASKEGYICWPANNLVLNCDSYNNCDETRQDADGFAVKLTVGDGNKLYGCVAYNNIDDGYDLYAKTVTGSIGAVVIENCVAYNNGYISESDLSNDNLTGEGNGFKLGGSGLPGKHQLINCIAFGNGAKGITSNSGPDVILKQCTAFDNNRFSKHQSGYSSENVSLYTKPVNPKTEYVVDGLISYMSFTQNTKQDKYELKEQSSIFSDTNFTWTGTNCQNASSVAVSNEWFKSLDIVNVNIQRGKDGTLILNGLLELTDKAPANVGARFYYNEQLDEAMYQLKVAQTLEQKYTALRAIDSQLDSMTEQEKAHLELSQYNKAIEEYNAYLGDYGDLTQTYQNMFGVIIAVAAVAVALGAAVITKFALRG